MRAGTVVGATTARPIGFEGCEGGWYELKTGGFVCHGSEAIAFEGERLPELRARQADREAPLPYEYATVRVATPIYKRLPGPDELIEVEPDPESDAGVAPPSGAGNDLLVRVLLPGFYVSLDRSFEKDGIRYWRTQQHGFVPEKRLRRKSGSDYAGQALGDGPWDLPVAVTRAEVTPVFEADGEKPRALGERLERRSWLPVASRQLLGRQSFVHLGQGRLVRARDVLVVEPSLPPAEVGEGERWIDVDLEQQLLVAYDWKRPRYVTLLSSGRRQAQPERDHRTPTGLYRIRAKHLTATMDGDEPGEPPYSLEDVPYVMYFEGAYAFHAAFWHDRFGEPRSHGCINLAPRDAKWLYDWAGPDLPEPWHGGYASDDNPGTWVWIHGQTP
jgi:hypothetical protein